MEVLKKNLTITIYGAGYVGLVTAACLAKLEYSVLCVDINSHRIAELNKGNVPIYEPGLKELIAESAGKNLLKFSTDVKAGVEFGLYQFIAVGTPPSANGSADLSYVYSVAEQIAKFRKDYCVVINKSTVPVGTADEVSTIIKKTCDRSKKSLSYAVVSNPEFLKEGSAIQDFMQPDRIVIGADCESAKELMQQLYQPYIAQGYNYLVMDIRSAELAKYTANAMLATKISFMNEISRIAECLNADINLVKQAISLDSRIGPYFINPGCGYGGSCFPKDVRALAFTAEQVGCSPLLLNAVEQVNSKQKQVLFDKIKHYYKNNLHNKKIAIWGLAFKPNTNDIREASSLQLIDALLQAGAHVQAYDPIANNEVQQLYPDASNFKICDSALTALDKVDALAIVTEWDEFKTFDLNQIKNKLANPVIFDGRNIYRLEDLQQLDIKYFAIGRGDKL